MPGRLQRHQYRGRYPARAFAPDSVVPSAADAAPAAVGEPQADSEPEADGVAEPDTTAAVEVPAPERADVAIVWGDEDVPVGTIYLDLRQPASLLAAAILEPWSQDSWYGAADDENTVPTGAWYPVGRVESPIETGMRAVPPAFGDDILGGP